jgi:AraC family transcriptional regulator
MSHKVIPSIQKMFFIENRDQFTFPEETLSEWLLLGLQAGAFSYSINGSPWIHCTPGDLVIVIPGQTMRRTITQKADFHAIYFKWNPGTSPQLSGRYTPQDIPRYLSAISHWNTPAQQCPAEVVHNRWNSLLYDLLQQLIYESHLPQISDKNPLDRPILQIAELLQKGPHTSENLAILSKRSGISPSQLSRRFKAVFGMTPATYRTLCKIEQSCRYLTNTNWTLERIADQCGFPNAFYFSRVFSRHKQCSPSTYRKTHSL